MINSLYKRKPSDVQINRQVLIELAKSGDKEAIKTLSKPPHNLKVYTKEETKAYIIAHQDKLPNRKG